MRGELLNHELERNMMVHNGGSCRAFNVFPYVSRKAHKCQDTTHILHTASRFNYIFKHGKRITVSRYRAKVFCKRFRAGGCIFFIIILYDKFFLLSKTTLTQRYLPLSTRRRKR